MKQFFLPLLVALSTSSCVMYQPRVVDWQDPFTGIRTRTMSVGESNQSQILTAMSSMNRPYYAPLRTVVPNTLLGMAISEGDTVLTYSQSEPIRQYDVPADGMIKIRLVSPRSRINQKGKSVIIYLPLLRKYHTSGGSLMVAGRVNKTALAALEQGVIDIVRVEPVTANESDPGTVDYSPLYDWAQAFQQGVPMLLGRKGRAVRSYEPQEAPDDRGLLRRLGKKK